MSITPQEPQASLDDVINAADHLDEVFGAGTGFQLAIRFNARSVNTLWEGAYNGYINWANAAIYFNIPPGDKSWSVDMLVEYDRAMTAQGEM